MTFKVWDKVRCIDDSDMKNIKEWHIYEVINIIWHFIYLQGMPDKNYMHWRFELVQEDKLPHELLWLDRYRVVKKDESDPLWELFFEWFNKYYHVDYDDSWDYFWHDWSNIGWWTDAYCDIEDFENSPTLITLAERDRCVNKKPSQTKPLSKPIRSCEHNWSIYKEDTIDWVSIEDMKATRDNINSKLQTWRNLFLNPNKWHYKNK